MLSGTPTSSIILYTKHSRLSEQDCTAEPQELWHSFYPRGWPRVPQHRTERPEGYGSPAVPQVASEPPHHQHAAPSLLRVGRGDFRLTGKGSYGSLLEETSAA